ncbi:hypothetical protein C9374_003909 [Naegleria lovaniensis]|uniref:Uncharacterized protein n=1 Tax=Naegleria lovaniensis TaxID=51637 RepID=A0AA88H051_NAELO|nr:uncharacterized protein C9374_003909 [Naegleria lovaniensis]KAG2394145.1 hypothetical protein C9374_003909 [Naegleria lovaniensis]
MMINATLPTETVGNNQSQQEQQPLDTKASETNNNNNNGTSVMNDHHTSTSTSFTNNNGLISATTSSGSSTPRRLLIKDTLLSSSDGFSSLMNNKRRIRKRKEHPSEAVSNNSDHNDHHQTNNNHHHVHVDKNSTTHHQQLTKRTKSSLPSSAKPIEYASNSAFLLSNILQASSLFSCSYNNTTLSYDPNAVLECPWKIKGNENSNSGESSLCLALEEPAKLENRLKRLLVATTRSRVSSSSSTPSSKYTLQIDPYCTLMLTGGRIYAENLDHPFAGDSNNNLLTHQAFNVLIHGLQDEQFVILQLHTHLLFSNVFVVYSRFGNLGSSGKTYSRLFDNAHHAKQFFANSLQSLLGLDLDDEENNGTMSSNMDLSVVGSCSKVCYQVPRIPLSMHLQQ